MNHLGFRESKNVQFNKHFVYCLLRECYYKIKHMHCSQFDSFYLSDINSIYYAPLN